MWIKINHELVNTDDIKSVKDGGARVLEYETGTTRYFKGSANGIVVTMKDGTRYTSMTVPRTVIEGNYAGPTF